MSEVKDPEQLIKQLQKDLEIKSQALYDCERLKRTAEALVIEAQEEIRILQSEENRNNKKLEEKIHQLEENNLSLKVSYNERLNYLEKELSSKDDEINDLKSKLDDVIKISVRQNSEDDEKLLEEIARLKEQNLELLNEVDDLNKICENKEIEITSLQDNYLQIKHELENYKEILDCKKNELDEANALIQTLKDDYVCVKSELDSLRSKPLDDKSRGNSLFAEVDDRRVQLQQNMNMMKTKYLEMKRERASHLKQIAALRNDNSNLLARWEAEVNEQKDDEDMILQSYKNQIHTLNEIIESYKKTSTIEIINDGSITFFDKMLNSKNQEIEALKNKLSSNSLNEVILSHDLATARREIREHKLEVLKLQNEVGQLKVVIEELKSPADSPSSNKQLPEEKQLTLQGIVKKDMRSVEEITEVNLDGTNKENVNGTEKKVQFSENTMEPKITDRSKYRRCKLLESKPLHISSSFPEK